MCTWIVPYDLDETLSCVPCLYDYNNELFQKTNFASSSLHNKLAV